MKSIVENLQRVVKKSSLFNNESLLARYKTIPGLECAKKSDKNSSDWKNSQIHLNWLSILVRLEENMGMVSLEFR